MAASNGKREKDNESVPDSGKPATDSSKNQIDENLRRIYDDFFEDDVPDRFRDLLNRLRDQDGDGTSNS